MTAAKKAKKSSELQFVYEEDPVTAVPPKKVESTVANSAPIEFAAHKVVEEAPVLNISKNTKNASSNDQTADFFYEVEEEEQEEKKVPQDQLNSTTVTKKQEILEEVPKKNEKAESPSIAMNSSFSDSAKIQAQLYEVKNEAKVKIAIAEFKTEFLSEHIGEAKILEYRIKQLLAPLTKSNNPSVVKQIIKIQKLLEQHAKGTTELAREKAKTKGSE